MGVISVLFGTDPQAVCALADLRMQFHIEKEVLKKKFLQVVEVTPTFALQSW
jgi:hypothetical protein